MLASTSDGVVIGFQVRPSFQAKKTCENEQIDVRLYSVIYKPLKKLNFMEGMVSPDFEEKIVATLK